MVTLERPRKAAVEQLTNPSVPRSPRARVVVGTLLALVTVACALAVPVSFGAFPSVYTPPLPDDAAFVVAGDVTTIEQYDDRIKTIKAIFGAQEPRDPAGADRFRRDGAKAMAVAAVLVKAQADRGIVIPDNKVREQLTGLVVQQFGEGPGGYKKFTDSLAQVGSSEAKLLDELRAQMGSTELVNAVTKDATASDEEVRAAFPRYAEKLGEPEQRRLSNIVVPTPEQANDLLNQIRAGAPFADLSRRFSIDPATKDSGGDLGMQSRDKLLPPYGDAAFGVAKGQPYGPVQTPQGWMVGQVVDIVPGKPAVFTDVQIPLENAVNAEKKLQVWRDFLANSIKDADIRYADAYRPADPLGLPPGIGPSQ